MNAIKPCKRPYIVFGGMAFFVLLIMLPSIFIEEKGFDLISTGLAAPIAAGLFAFVYLHSQKVVFSDEIVSYTSWYFWHRTIRIKNIEKWSIQASISERHSLKERLKPFLRLEIHPIDKNQDDTIVIGIKPYDVSDLKRLFAVLPKDKERE